MATDLAQPLLKLNKWYWSKVIRAIIRVCYLYFFLNRCCSWVHEALTLNLLKNHFVKGCYNMCDWNINSSTHRSENGQNFSPENQTSKLWGKKGMIESCKRSCWTNFPQQHHGKCMENSVENMHSRLIRTKHVLRNTYLFRWCFFQSCSKFFTTTSWSWRCLSFHILRYWLQEIKCYTQFVLPPSSS